MLVIVQSISSNGLELAGRKKILYHTSKLEILEGFENHIEIKLVSTIFGPPKIERLIDIHCNRASIRFHLN